MNNKLIEYICISFISIVLFTSCGANKNIAIAKTPVSTIPATEQLKAIQIKYPDVTIQTLTEGHSIFTGACTRCHGERNIYKRTETKWLHEIDEMAPKAKLTALQKDALIKYVLSVKYAEPERKK